MTPRNRYDDPLSRELLPIAFWRGAPYLLPCKRRHAHVRCLSARLEKPAKPVPPTAVGVTSGSPRSFSSPAMTRPRRFGHAAPVVTPGLPIDSPRPTFTCGLVRRNRTGESAAGATQGQLVEGMHWSPCPSRPTRVHGCRVLPCRLVLPLVCPVRLCRFGGPQWHRHPLQPGGRREHR